ncbi:MAG: orotidine 5'-phosphate decarboxylase [Spirochaetes bacterium GWF1_51_8]|nr:MAG: orotidine 5'-phosphate decarboxylase [Spirochaetes bacterium GWF1_51_8]
MATKLIAVLDMNDFQEAKKAVDLLAGLDVLFKVGSTLYPADGKQTIEYIKKKGAGVFLDLKFFDIPNQVKGSCAAVTRLGVDMFTIHLLGGKEMIRSAVEGVYDAVNSSGLEKAPLILGVTVLTSMNDEILKNDLCIEKPVAEMVSHLAEIGYGEGIRGFVCSPHEIELMKKKFPDVKLVTPGIRPSAGGDDQKRVMTPARAAELGADYIVVGRPIFDAEDPRAVAEKILSEIGVIE